ncbi:MAG: PEP/pyruvate-binding domain-containing protein [Pseudomonadota bacterium]|nr:PEP/pyruvate-binding domain-containing protein [Pseudomonadota bacterium]
MTTMYTTPIKTTQNDLDLVGGKGRSLARMSCADFDVPGGFLVTTDAYKKFIADSDLKSKIIELAKPELRDGYPNFELSSKEINKIIQNAKIDANIVDQIKVAYQQLDQANLSVAVRSSANAEDLPDFSFAGQQETFLNVSGEDEVVSAVKKCWSSLWTAQAISYRHQNGIDQSSVAMGVVVQVMIPSEVSGILFTANPTNGERSEMIVNSSFGLGEAVVGGQVTPDTFIVDRTTLTSKETILGPKEHQIVYDGDQGIKIEKVSESNQGISSLSDSMLTELCNAALKVEALYEGKPQDIEWAFCNGKLHLLQSRPITNLPVQPIEVDWTPPSPAKYVARRQIVENMPEPLCPLFEELYLLRGLELVRPEGAGMVGGGPLFVTVNGYGYMRFDHQIIHDMNIEKIKDLSEEEIEAEDFKMMRKYSADAYARVSTMAVSDVKIFQEELKPEDRKLFDDWYEKSGREEIDGILTIPYPDFPTFIAFNHTTWNNKILKRWFEYTKPRLENVAKKWKEINISNASNQTLLDGITEMGIEEGNYWSDDSSHTFGVAKSTDDQFNTFLKTVLPDHNFTSGQFLSGIDSKSMQANADLFEIAKLIRGNDELEYLVLTVPAPFLMEALQKNEKAKEVNRALDNLFSIYGHQGYSLDFIEPTQEEDPSGLFASLKSMVRDKSYHPDNQKAKTAKIRKEKYEEISKLLSGLEYWQFRYRWWLALKFNYIREEVAFYFGYTWSILRPMAFELNQRLVGASILKGNHDIFFLKTDEIADCISLLESNKSTEKYIPSVEERINYREACKRHHPPGTLPSYASKVDGISFKETQRKNDDNSNEMLGFPVSSGIITAKASVVTGPSEFDKMEPGTILVSPLTTPAWTQLFAHAVGLVTDIGSILAHGSIVAREYGIPAVLGVGNGTIRIKHGQTITIDGDAGTVIIHEDD